MRKRIEIEKEAKEAYYALNKMAKIQLEVLLDIRELVTIPKKSVQLSRRKK